MRDPSQTALDSNLGSLFGRVDHKLRVFHAEREAVAQTTDHLFRNETKVALGAAIGAGLMSVAYSHAIPADRNAPESSKSIEGRWVEGERFKLHSYGGVMLCSMTMSTSRSIPRRAAGLACTYLSQMLTRVCWTSDQSNLCARRSGEHGKCRRCAVAHASPVGVFAFVQLVLSGEFLGLATVRKDGASASGGWLVRDEAEQRTASLRSGRDLQTEGPPCQKVQTTRSGSAPQGTARNTGEKSATVTGGA